MTAFDGLFEDTNATLYDVAGWNTQAATSMDRMFANIVGTVDVSAWKTSSVTSAVSMFEGAASFNSPLTAWDTSKFQSMVSMFEGAVAFNQPISHFDTGAVTNMTSMLKGASSFAQTVDCFDTSVLTDASSMFENASAFVPTLGCWDVAALMAHDAMFIGTLHTGVCTAYNASPAGCTCGGCATPAETTTFPIVLAVGMGSLGLVTVLGIMFGLNGRRTGTTTYETVYPEFTL